MPMKIWITHGQKVQSAYQRRADLIPNLVNTVKGVASFEKKHPYCGDRGCVQRQQSITIDPANATPEQLAAFQQAQGGISQSLGRLMVIAEQYPELKANQNFLELQSQLEGTENRIKVARDTYNDVSTQYNKKCGVFKQPFLLAYLDSTKISIQASKMQGMLLT
nr:LemA family protein [Haliscomenobacter sp.]